MKATDRNRIAAIVVAVAAAASASQQLLAQQPNWQAELVAIEPVAELRQIDGEVFVRGERWYAASHCGDMVCFDRRRPPTETPARDGIPGGVIARADGAGIVEAWYAEPTTRYDHGILGDSIEGGALVVVDDAGRRHEVTLDAGHVFEDLTPRIADIDGDGRNDVVTIRSGLDAGAAIAVYAVPDSALVEIAGIPEIGLTHRWLNVAGMADFTGDGRLDIALVKTPHIGGRLEIWSFADGALHQVAAANGFSNHAIGSTELGLSAVADVNGDGVADLALPDNSRSALRIVSAAGGELREIAGVGLPGQVATAIGALAAGEDVVFLAGLQDGRLVQVRR